MALSVLIGWEGSIGLSSPNDVPDLALDWDATDFTLLSDGTAIGGTNTWTSKAGTSVASQSSSTARPTKQTVNGETCVRFDGTNDWLTLNGDALTATQNMTGVSVFARAKVTPAAATKRIIYLSTGTVNNDARVSLYVSAANTLTTGSRRLDADAAQNISGSNPGSTNIRVMTGILDYANTDAFLYLDSVLDASTTTFQTAGSTSNTPSVAATLGSRADGAAEFLGMDLYRVLLWSRVLTDDERETVETYLLAGGAGAVNETSRVRSRTSPVSFTYGRDQSTALAPTVAGVGSFVLDNSDSRYSPRNTSSPLYGNIKPARPVRVTRTINGTDYVLFNGHTDDNPINPDVNAKTVTISLVDALAQFRGQTIKTAVYDAIRTGEAIGYILDACGWPTSLRDLDAGATVIPWWWEDGTDALTALDKVVKSEGSPAMLTVGSDGSIVFKDRHHRLTDTASLTSQSTWNSQPGTEPVISSTGFSYDEAWRNIINTGAVTVDNRAVGSLEAVWTSEDQIIMSSGEQLVITAVTNAPVVNAETMIEGTDYIVHSGSVTVELVRTSGASIPIRIISTGDSIVTILQLRAQPLNTTQSIEISASDAGSISDFGRREYPGDLPWCNRYDAEAVLGVTVALRAQPAPIIQARFVIPSSNTAKAEAILARDLSDRVTIVEDETITDSDFYVESIAHEFTDELDHAVTFGTEAVPVTIGTPFRFNTSGAGFDDGLFTFGVDDPATMFRFDAVSSGHRFNDGFFAN